MSYVMSCGCVLEESDLKRVNNRKTCMQHGGTIKGRKGICKNDGNAFYRAVRGKLGFLCDDCAAEDKLKASKKRQAKRKAARLSGFQAESKLPNDCSGRGDYCKSALGCSQYPACLDCDVFYPIWDNVDPGRMEQWTL